MKDNMIFYTTLAKRINFLDDKAGHGLMNKFWNFQHDYYDFRHSVSV